MKIFSILILISLLSACATMSKDECKIADWKAVGLKDASQGEDKFKIDTYTSACKKVHILPDKNQYFLGYNQGLKLYCTPQNIFNQGLSGTGDYQICPVSEQENLKSYYDVSYAYYQASEERQRLINDINFYENLSRNPKATSKEKANYKLNLNLLESKRNKVMNTFYDAEDTMERFKRVKNLSSLNP